MMSYERVFKQIERKPLKVARMERFSKTKKRKFGKNLYPCRKCGKTSGVVRQYGIQYCRQCFREEAKKMGFRKY
jgi:small subunit ribosomal protein S14